MIKTVTAITIIAALITGCSSETGSGKTADSATVNTEKTNSERDDSDDNKESKMSNNENWETIEGVKIRKNATMQKQLEGKTYVLFENYNSGGGSGGYNSERRMNLCPGGEITTYEQSHTSIYIEGADASSASEDADSGTWQVYEDEGGNLFLKIKMKKSGEGFVNFQLKDGKLIMGGQSYSIVNGEC
ncbi:MAG: hypothetical protein L6Q81_14090 [Bacteroidia bacterium]|nr:hypothetical protein [Bacteroidia bacterium]